jgi:hypothetical protein
VTIPLAAIVMLNAVALAGAVGVAVGRRQAEGEAEVRAKRIAAQHKAENDAANAKTYKETEEMMVFAARLERHMAAQRMLEAGEKLWADPEHRGAARVWYVACATTFPTTDSGKEARKRIEDEVAIERQAGR